jgi:ATP-dependent Zn protease
VVADPATAVPVHLLAAAAPVARRGQPDASGDGQSKAEVFDAERPATTFADVAGYEGAKAEIAEIAEVVDFLRQPGRY